jgi:hypothetical protein
MVASSTIYQTRQTPQVTQKFYDVCSCRSSPQTAERSTRFIIKLQEDFQATEVAVISGRVKAMLLCKYFRQALSYSMRQARFYLSC